MKTPVLITGITGFVGSHMADLLIGRNDLRLYGLRRWHLSRQRNVKHLIDDPRVTWIDCDLTDPVAVDQAIELAKPALTFHFAAESFVSPSWAHPSHYMDVNYKGTVNLLEALKRWAPSCRLLIPGSGEEYGEIHEDELPITEATALRPVNPYAVSKVAQDLISFVYFKSYGLPVVRVRTFNHEGPRRDRVFGISSYACQVARIEAGLQPPVIKVGHLDDRRNFTHIRDIVDAYWLAMENCEPGELYLIGSEAPETIWTFRQALDMLREMATVASIDVETEPAFVRPTAVPRLIANTQKFRDLTGWAPKLSFQQILSDTLNYWREAIQRNADD